MDTPASRLIDALEGTSAVSRMIEAPVSTVHSWRKNGIPASRFAHLRLAARAAGLPIDFEAFSTAVADRTPASERAAA